jgi:preprotein translocase subunit SecE
MTARSKSAPAKKSRFSFFPGVVAELRKAHWPTRQEALRLSILVLIVCIVVGQEALRLSILVLIVCIVVGAILGVLDLAFARLFLLLGG